MGPYLDFRSLTLRCSFFDFFFIEFSGPKWAWAQMGLGPNGPGPKWARTKMVPDPNGPGPIWARAHLGPGPFGRGPIFEKTKSIHRSTEIELRTHLIVQNAQNSTANTMGLVPEPQTAKNISKNCQKVPHHHHICLYIFS